MCGRYGRDLLWEDIYQQLDAFTRAAIPNDIVNMDIRPTTRQPVVTQTEEGRELRMMRWGLVPFWHGGKAIKDFKLTTFNAKQETVATAASYKGPYAKRHCLVPATGWYEWTGQKGAKTKWWFTPKSGELLTFAGLWERCNTADQGEVESFTIITQPAGAPLNAYHDRAPVVIFPEHRRQWLDVTQDSSTLLGPESPDLFKVVQAA
jgi:putative SOS response-associated peptidase YedK